MILYVVIVVLALLLFCAVYQNMRLKHDLNKFKRMNRDLHNQIKKFNKKL